MEEVYVRFFYDNTEFTDDEPMEICMFHCRKYAEYLRFLQYCKKYEIEFWPRDDDEKMNQKTLEKMNGMGAFIDGIYVKFGSDDVIQGIEVYLK